MKLRKRILSLILAANMAAAGTMNVGAVSVSNVFKDIGDTWYTDAVQYVYDNDLMAGVSPTSFAPNQNLTREMTAQILYKSVGTPSVGNSSAPFSDVSKNAWYHDAICWAYQNNIIQGYGNGKFGVKDNITREQLAVILYSMFGKPAVSGTINAHDDLDISEWAKNAVTWAIRSGIMSGTTILHGYQIDIQPKGNATRAQAAVMFKQYAEHKKMSRGQVSNVLFAVEDIISDDALGSTVHGTANGFDVYGNVIWTYTTGFYSGGTELTCLEGIGIHDDRYYLREDGHIVALNKNTGKVVWKNNDISGFEGDVFIDEDGMIYSCGTYGPDFCAINPDGKTVKYIDYFATYGYERPYSIRREGKYIAVLFQGVNEKNMTRAVFVDPTDFSFKLNHFVYDPNNPELP